MKRLIIILFILCPLMTQGKLQAQIYSTASSRHRTYTNGGVVIVPAPLEFQSTSLYKTSTRKKSYATAPMQVANGSIRTVASSVTGGVLLENNTNTGDNGYIQPGENGAVIAGVPDLPIGDGWDVALLLGLLCAGYVVFRYRKQRENQLS